MAVRACACFITPDDSLQSNTQQVVAHKYAVPYVLAQGIWILSGIYFLFSRYIRFFCSFKFKTFPYIGDDEILKISQCST